VKGKCDNDLMMMSVCCYGSSEMQVPTPQPLHHDPNCNKGIWQLWCSYV